jgi:two-component system OmpR family response regulator
MICTKWNENMLSVLLVDDDIHSAQFIIEYLSNIDMNVVVLNDGNLVAEAFEKRAFDIAILDIARQGWNGLTLCRSLHQKTNIPIIMLAAPEDMSGQIEALELGADDYIVKPFDIRELVVRIQTIVRRAKSRYGNNNRLMQSEVVSFMGWQLNCILRQLTTHDNSVVSLSNAEFRLLKAFIDHPRSVLTRDFLVHQAQGQITDSHGRRMDILVSRLRKKLGDKPRSPTLIKTIHGDGYFFDANVQSGERNSEQVS